MKKNFSFGYILCLYLSLCFSHLYSQQVSVDPLTGSASVVIPLHTVQTGGITIPINLSHHGGSVKVPAPEQNCGIGWNLSVDWSVQRVTRGLPDDLVSATRNGWLTASNATSIQNFTPSADNSQATCTDENTDWTFLEGRGYTKDTEPDLFYFQAPGLSGEFVFDASGTPKFLNLQDLSVTVTKNANQEIIKFIIKTSTGLVYTFATTESVVRKSERWLAVTPDHFLTEYNQYLDELTYISTWHLTSIRSSVTGVKANFSYIEGTESFQRDYKVKIQENNQVDTLYSVSNKVTPKYLGNISLKGHTITIGRYASEIQVITIEEATSNDRRQYEFQYGQLKSATDTYPFRSVMFLRAISQVDACNPLRAYTFSYTDVNFPPGTIATTPVLLNKVWGQDWFGYYNGANTNKNIPTIYFYSGETGPRRFRTTPIPGVTPTQTITGLDRSINTSLVAFGSLSQIKYPTGGFENITYEPNYYYDTSTGEELTGPGVRVSSITSHGGDAAYGGSSTNTNSWRVLRKDYEYKQSNGTTSSGKLISSPAFAFATGSTILRTQSTASESPVVNYTRVKEKIPGQGSIVYEFAVPGAYPSVSESDWQVPQSKFARNPGNCTTLNNVTNSSYTFPFAPATNYDFERGLLSLRSEYSETGTLVRERIPTYVRLSKNPATLKGLRFEKIGDAYHYSVYTILTGYTKVISQEIVKEASEETPANISQSTIVYTYDANNLLQQVATTNPDNSINKEKFIYAKNFTFTTPTTGHALAIKMLNDSSRHAEVIEHISRFTPALGTEIVSGAQLTRFKIFNGKALPFKVYNFPKGATLTEATASGQVLVFDSVDYRLINTLEEYDAESRILSSYSYKRERAANHYAVFSSLPVASIFNAKAKQVVYEGFEAPTTLGFSSAGFSTTVRTGKKAIQFTISSAISSVQPVEKGENKYRFSCWALASQATILTLRAKNGGVTQASTTISYTSTDVNNWTYLEGIFDVTTASSSFTLEVANNAAITLDDIVFIPLSARITTTTVLPLTGQTSVTDDRGNSMVTTYDTQGRKKSTFDAKRNLVALNEYQNITQPTPYVNSGFEPSTTSFIAGQPVTFTAGANCLTVTHQWKINGTAAGTGSTLNQTFNTPGGYTIEYTATNATYGSSTTALTICVELIYSPNLTLFPEGNEFVCATQSRTFSVTNVPVGCSATYEWWILPDATGSWFKLTTDFSYNGSSITYGAQADYEMKVYVTITCGSQIELPCTGAVTVKREASVWMNYNPPVPGQDEC